MDKTILGKSLGYHRHAGSRVANDSERFMARAQLSPPTPGQTGLRDLLDTYSARIKDATGVHVAQFYDRAFRQAERLIAAQTLNTKHDVNEFLRALQSHKLSALDDKIKAACGISENESGDIFACSSLWITAASWLAST